MILWFRPGLFAVLWALITERATTPGGSTLLVISAAALSRIKSPVPGVVERQVKVKKLFISFAANRQTDRRSVLCTDSLQTGGKSSERVTFPRGTWICPEPRLTNYMVRPLGPNKFVFQDRIHDFIRTEWSTLEYEISLEPIRFDLHMVQHVGVTRTMCVELVDAAATDKQK